jgi:DNA-3-methyladenine glycosylase
MSSHDLEALLSQGAVSAARDLIGWRLYAVEPDGTRTGGVIVETEAYQQDDAASHSYHGRTPRTDVMFGPPGRLYVYFTYGMHWCVNIVTGVEGTGEAVLFRAIVADSGLDYIQKRRGNRPDAELTNGPAKLCQALAITGEDQGTLINDGHLLLLPPRPEHTRLNIKTTERIGIRKDTHRLWRFITSDISATP